MAFGIDLPFEILLLILVVVVVLLYFVLKALVEALVALVKWIGDVAIPWICETAEAIWDKFVSTPPITVPVPEAPPVTVPETKPAPIPVPVPIPITVPIPKDETIPRNRGPWNVYDVHVIIPGDYGDYQRGIPNPTSVYLVTGEIYKYGRTTYSSVLRRYEAFPWTSFKEAMILENLKNGKFGAVEWYAFRVNLALAIFVETGLISAYEAIRGKYPPGNTGLY
ncbi:hypothetical protein [Chryseobacterium sp. SIMBA_029]|uniref:hypothetical protein n=1 Tax=Chryseobacterium sp. SIMBA_029 TaxID=3085772 RepID=UPI00397ADDE0